MLLRLVWKVELSVLLEIQGSANGTLCLYSFGIHGGIHYIFIVYSIYSKQIFSRVEIGKISRIFTVSNCKLEIM